MSRIHPLIACLLALLAACVPKPRLLEIPPPPFASLPADGPAVHLEWPLDARPAHERRDAGYFDTTLPLPILMYGDLNLRPSPAAALDRAVQGALGERGIPVADDPGQADLRVRVHLLRHSGFRDTSDAQWVSTLTGGIAGTAGKFLYPTFVVVEGQVRVEVQDRDGRVLARRDVARFLVERRPVAHTWGVFSLFRRNVVAELFEEAFLALHTDLGRTVASVVAEAREGGPVEAGLEPREPLYPSLAEDWRVADRVSLRDGTRDATAHRRYTHERFSLFSGHDTRRGEVVGRIALPLETFGYDVGLTDHLQAQANFTVLGLVNSASGGVRVQVHRFGHNRLALQGTAGGDLAVLPLERRVVLASTRLGLTALWSHRRDELTWFGQAGVHGVQVHQELPAFDTLSRGRVLGVSAGPGLEVQLTPTLVLGGRVVATAHFQHGDPLRLGPLGPFLAVPQVGVGLR